MKEKNYRIATIIKFVLVIAASIFVYIYALLSMSCATTVQLDKDVKLHKEVVETLIEEEAAEIPKEDIPQIIYMEKPVYYPQSTPNTGSNETKAVTGRTAVEQYQKDILQVPEYDSGHLIRYTFNDNYVYEVHCQPYRTTDIELEPGEEVLETPFISEPDVWQMAAGESIKKGLKTMHFFVKPDHQKLTSSLIIITNKRVYHIELKSFYDYYMPIVRWTYPEDLLIKRIEQVKAERIERTRETFETYSFNYKIRIGIFAKKVLWIPKQVYDDGTHTYIVLDERCLQNELPALFNKKNEIVNYRVDKNMLIVDELIVKMTLRIDNKKITVYKKK
jgi:type IV secretion system protein VirB9